MWVFVYRPVETLHDVVSVLQSKVLSEVQLFSIRREHVLEDIIKESKRWSFTPLKKVETYFAGEAAKDTGGVTRELWRLLSTEVEGLCDGREACKIFRHDAVKLKV